MRIFIFPAVALAAAMTVVAPSCRNSSGAEEASGATEEISSVEQILQEMRTDSVWISRLDSLAAVHIGPGAKCLDAVKHTFSWNDRLWVYNQDWGGVLEIPAGYVPFDNPIQAELSYHGAGIQSPDTFVYISHYEAFQSFGYEEYKQMHQESFDTDSLFTKVTVREETMKYKDGTESPVIIFETMNVDGIKGYFKYIFTSPESTQFAVSLQYPAENENRYGYIREMIDRYPFGPQGLDPRQEF